MWVGVQVIIFVGLVCAALILPKTIYSILIGIGVIFAVCAVFANWLLVIQIFNILAAGGLGFKIIESRDSYFEKIYTKIMRIGKDNNRFRIPNDSKIPVITVICSVIIIVLYFWSFYTIDGEFNSVLITPFEWFEYYNFIDVIRYIDFSGDVLLLYFSCVYAKKNIEVFVIPAIIKVVVMVMLEVYYGITLGHWGYITKNWFVAISFIIIFAMFLLVVNNRIKSKLPTVIASLAPVVVSIILCVQHKPPFVYSDGAVALSSLISFIAYCVGYAALAYALDNNHREAILF